MVKEAKYSLIKKLDNVKIRLHNSLIISEVVCYENRGFNLLFNCILEKDTTKINLKMPAPVLSEKDSLKLLDFSKRNTIAPTSH
jgi:hypothetical protein